jgi:putative RecB family exonuclease
MVNVDRQPDQLAGKDKQQGPNYLSPTALKTFSECPKRFRFAYIERPEVDEQASAHLVFGNCLHKALAWLYRLPDQERSVAAAHKLLRHAWANAPDRGAAFITEAEEMTWGEQALKALDWYCTNYQLSGPSEAIEDWVQAALPNEQRIGGLIDRLAKRQDPIGGLEVIDYKSGKCRLEDDDLPRDFAAQVYCLAASRAFARPVTRVRFIYLVEEVERRWEVEFEDFEAAAKRLVEATEAINAETKFPARPDRHCRFCKYRQLCPERDQITLDQFEAAPETVF